MWWGSLLNLPALFAFIRLNGLSSLESNGLAKMIGQNPQLRVLQWDRP
jgi:hypothetical protein